MRRPIELAEDTRARELYGEAVVHERHRHRYEVNNHFRPQLVDAGLVVSGTVYEGRLVEIVELPDHPWFVASQFHPEFKSRPVRPAPLFREFVGAAYERAGERGSALAAGTLRAHAESSRRDVSRRLNLERERVYLARRNEISRRVEMPASTGSPPLRARTNITSSDWLSAAGNFFSRSIRRIAMPSPPVCCSGGMANWLYGTAVT